MDRITASKKGSFFLNQFWTFSLHEAGTTTITLGVRDELTPQTLRFHLMRNDNTLLASEQCRSGDYVQIRPYLTAGKYVILITAYEGMVAQTGHYWLAVEQ